MKFCKVMVGGVTIKDTSASPDPKQLISWEAEKDSNVISDAELIVPRSISDIVDLKNGQTVEIWAGWTTSTDVRYFYGYIDNIKPEGAILTIMCKNEMIKLVRKNVNHIYDSSIDASAGEVSEIFEDLVETYGGMTATVQPSGTEDGKRVDQFKCINSDIFERIMALKEALDWDVYYNDSDKKVYFEPFGYNDSEKTLTVGTEIIAMPEWTFDDSNMINDLRIDGATSQTNITESGQIGVTAGYTTTGITLTNTPDIVELYMDASNPPTTQKTGGSKDSSSGHFFYIDKENKKVMPTTSTTFTANHYAQINYVWSAPSPIHMVNQKSIDDYGIRQKTTELSDVSSVADAESRAVSILSKRSVPFITGRLKIKSESASMPNRGELIDIVDTRTSQVNGLTLSGKYVVSKIKYLFPSAYEEIEIGDKQWRLADWQQTAEERLRRLEEQLVRNQDILIELVDISNEETLHPRYRQVKKETMADGSNFILGHSSQGLLGSDVLGRQADASVNHFIQQFEDSYTENFIDDDFEGSGTASWSTTGSVTFTSGQIALSLPIDYGNGTITTATLTSTEGSGSFTYEMTADGTNWETVTSGTAKTFVNTGTDLRWRATENATSTGEITKLEITSYH